MKKFLFLPALVCAVAVSLSPTVAYADTSDVFTQPTFSFSPVNGATYLEQSLTYNNKLQKMFYGEYGAESGGDYEWVIHSIRSGSKTTRSTVSQIADDYERQTGRKVILAANGDYFDLGTGSNMESYVNDGIVVSKGSFITKHCIGFDNNGKVVVGRMTETVERVLIRADSGNLLFELEGFNREPSEEGITVYTVPGTYTVANAGKYVMATDSANIEQLPAYGSSRRMTQGTPLNDDSFTLKSGQFAVVVRGEENAQTFYDTVTFGTSVDLVELPAGDYEGCTWVLGGYDILVDGGKVNTSCHTDNDGNGYAPRTFIGFKEDGTGFICVVDGRQPGYSVGITVNEEAQLAAQLGAQYALELDGGGSSTMLVRIDDELVLRNVPSDMSMRAVSNAIMLVEKPKATDPDPQPDDPDPDPVPESGKSGCFGAGEISILLYFATAVVVPTGYVAVKRMHDKRRNSK